MLETILGHLFSSFVLLLLGYGVKVLKGYRIVIVKNKEWLVFKKTLPRFSSFFEI